MKVVNNGYTRTKVNGVYADQIAILNRTILTGFTHILEKHGIGTGEPAIIKDAKNNTTYAGFYTSYSTFYYNDINDEIVIRFNETMISKEDKANIVIKTYKNINDELITDLKQVMKDNSKNDNLEYKLQRIESYKDLEEDWNSYRCNPVSEKSIELAKNFITYLHSVINTDEVYVESFPVADGGNEIRRPAEGSLSIVQIEMDNGDRSVEFEISQEGEVVPIVYSHAYDSATNESHGLEWPIEYTSMPEDYTINKDYDKDEFLKWVIKWIHFEE